jgi:hypothetical protein
MPNQTTQLASGLINGHDRLTVELVEPADLPVTILITWPAKPSVTDPAKFTALVAATIRVLADARIELAARRAAGL